MTIHSTINKMSAELMFCIKAEQKIDDKWIDITRRCQLCDPIGGCALLLDLKDGQTIFDEKTMQIKRHWELGMFRLTVPDNSPDAIKKELHGYDA
jgi:hypothetical protein